MANQLHMYMNSPTAAGTDGTEVSMDGAQTAPISVTLNATQAESKAIKLALRCDTGYKIDGNVALSLTGTNSAKWKLALDNSYADAATALSSATWSDTIDVASVEATNVIFWAKAASSTDETPAKDISVKVVATGTVVAV